MSLPFKRKQRICRGFWNVTKHHKKRFKISVEEWRLGKVSWYITKLSKMQKSQKLTLRLFNQYWQLCRRLGLVFWCIKDQCFISLQLKKKNSNLCFFTHFSEKQKMADIKAVKRALDEREKVSLELDVCILFLVLVFRSCCCYSSKIIVKVFQK